MSFSVRQFFSTLFLSVILESKECQFYGKVMKNGKLIKTIDAKFQSEDSQELNAKMIDYIKRQKEEYKWVYIAYFLDALGQGALPCASSEEFEKFGVNINDINFTKIDEGWFVYADMVDIVEAKSKFKDFGLDFMYSPIALLHKVVMSREENLKNTLYIYNHKDCFALCVIDNKKLKFGSFARLNDAISVANAIKDKDDFGLSAENIDEIDEFIAEVDDSFESLDDLQSLDELFSQNDENDEFEDLNYDLNMPTSTDVTASISLFGRDMSMYQFITVALKEFYSNPNYKSDFIQDIVIFDNEKTSATFLQFLQTELLVQTTLYPVETAKIMTQLMIDEVGI
ncbi:MAG: hypothetical protein ACTTJC_05530 [Campylobacter sp.]